MCDRWGIPHSHFLGGPLRWSDLDRAKAVAYLEFEGSRCPNCHTRAEDWDPAQGGHRFAFIAETRECNGCSVASELNQQVPDRMRAAGVRVVLTPNPELVGVDGG